MFFAPFTSRSTCKLHDGHRNVFALPSIWFKVPHEEHVLLSVIDALSLSVFDTAARPSPPHNPWQTSRKDLLDVKASMECEEPCERKYIHIGGTGAIMVHIYHKATCSAKDPKGIPESNLRLKLSILTQIRNMLLTTEIAEIRNSIPTQSPSWVEPPCASLQCEQEFIEPIYMSQAVPRRHENVQTKQRRHRSQKRLNRAMQRRDQRRGTPPNGATLVHRTVRSRR